jgi:Flp pilus assembly protein TadD
LPPRDDWSTQPAIPPTDAAIEAVAALLGEEAAPSRVTPAQADAAEPDAEPTPAEAADPAIEELDRIATSLFGERPPDLPPIVVPAPANPATTGQTGEAEIGDEGRLAALFGQMGDRSAGATVPEASAEPVDAAPPADPAATALLEEGNAFFNVGQYSLAIERYTGALERSPQLVAALYNRGNAYARTGDLDRARADYDRAIGLVPGDADALNNRGMVHLYRGDYRAAKSDFDRAVDLAPDDMTILVNRGLAWLHVGQPERAMIDFRDAMEHAPSDGAAYYGGAQAAVRSGDFGSALDYLRHAFSIDHTYVREAAADPMLAGLDGYEPFHRLLRQFGARP